MKCPEKAFFSLIAIFILSMTYGSKIMAIRSVSGGRTRGFKEMEAG
jgi:hypothetical protein